jgi:transcription elongation factor Elf1
MIDRRNGFDLEHSFKQAASWIFTCPYCDPSKIMNISTILPTMYNGSSIITYHCDKCGFDERITLEH